MKEYYQKLIEDSNKKLSEIEHKNKLRKNQMIESKNDIKQLKEILDSTYNQKLENINRIEDENKLLKDKINRNINRFNSTNSLRQNEILLKIIKNDIEKDKEINKLKIQIKESIFWKLETANTMEELKEGLMNRKFLTFNQGMLFNFPILDNHTLWMKNTLIPLDAIFLDENKKIIGLIENMEPKSENIRSINKKSKYIIEINGGSIDKYNIKLDDILKFNFSDKDFEYYTIISFNKK